MGTMCKRSNYTQNAPRYEGDCEYRISSIIYYSDIFYSRLADMLGSFGRHIKGWGKLRAQLLLSSTALYSNLES